MGEVKHGFVRTYTGSKVQFIDPDPNAIDLNGLGTALARAERFNGHLNDRWTVAEHSLVMSYMAKDPRMAMALLLHDAHEAFTGDIPAPLKRVIAQHTGILHEVEVGLNRAISKALGDVPMQYVNLTEVEDDEIKRLDKAMGWLEANMSLPGFVEEEWEDQDTFVDENEFARAHMIFMAMSDDHENIHKIEQKDPSIWLREKFLRRFYVLRNKLAEGGNLKDEEIGNEFDENDFVE